MRLDHHLQNEKVANDGDETQAYSAMEAPKDFAESNCPVWNPPSETSPAHVPEEPPNEVPVPRLVFEAFCCQYLRLSLLPSRRS